MKRDKKILIFGLMLILFSTISFAAANDVDNTTLEMTDDLNAIESINSEILTDSPATFTQLNEKIQQASPGGSITLDKDYTYVESDDANGIIIGKSMTIDGAGHTLNGANKASIFKITSGYHVILKNINFINANATNGAAISLTNSSFEITNSKFINNNALENGGAIYISVGSALTTTSTIINSSFINNKAYNGGAGYVDDDWVLISNSTFKNNFASRNGGALIWIGMNGTVEKSNFINNTANLGDGGALYLYPDVSESIFEGINIINSSSFINNKAEFNGGSIYCSGLFTLMRNSQFRFDKARNGGAMYLDVGSAISNCTFFKETALGSGGAIYLSANNDLSALKEDNPFLKYIGVRDSKIINCTAAINGGGGYAAGDYGYVMNVSFINNNAGHDGGAGYIAGNYGILSNSTFINNLAAHDGGALMWSGNEGNVSDINCIRNRAEGGSGSICLSGSNIAISSSNFSLSQATLSGGAIYVYGDNAKIYDSLFDRCEAVAQDGGAIYVYGLNTLIYDSNFTMNRVNFGAARGGSIYIEGNRSRISNSNFERCTAFEGGFVYVNGNDAVIENTTGKYSFASNGGAFYINGQYCTISNSNFSYNNASNAAGGIYVAGDFANISKIYLAQCIAYLGDGGSIYIDGSNTTISKAKFVQNRANGPKSAGGSINIHGNYTRILNCTFDMCTAFDGGVIYIDGSYAVIDGYSCIHSLANNDGGAIYVKGDHAYIADFDISLTNASSSGGAIYIEGDFTKIHNSNFTRCISYYGDGGALYVAGLNTTIDKSNFVQNRVNTVNGRGGSVNIQGNNVHILNCTYDMCTAFDGGVVFINGSHAVIDGYSCVRSFAANDGGAMYIAGDHAYIADFNISLTNATNYGGAIYIEGDNSNISNSNFTRCIAYNNDGGALYVVGLNTFISKSNFLQNRVNNVTGRGGSINVQGNSTWILNCTFVMCNAYEGGVIYVNGSHVMIDGYSCTKSLASNDGGAMYVAGDYVTVKNFDISLTNATNYGGALYVSGDNVNIHNSNFTRCIADNGNGGAMYVSGLNSTISESTFTKNRVNMENGRGGSIEIQGSHTKLFNCTFDMCSAYEGGVMFINGSYAVLDGITSTHSFASNDGGAIYVAGDFESISNFTVAFTNATNNGGAICISGDMDVNVTNGNFTTCIAVNGDGGAIYIGGYDATVDGCEFDRTQAQNGRGGAIFIEGDLATVSHSEFAHSFAYDGGIIYISGNNAEIIKNNLTYSWAADAGGSIFIEGHDVVIDSSNFACTNASSSESEYAGWGGALYIEGDNVNITSSTFLKTIAEKGGSGGAIFIMGENVNIEYSNFTYCAAPDYFRLDGGASAAGAIAIGGSDATIYKSNFMFCNARSGGVMFIEGVNTSIIDSYISKSFADNDGGSLYIYGENTNVSGTVFEYTWAGRDGGAIYIRFGENTNIEYSNFTRCNATQGGAIDVDGNNVSIIDSDLVECFSKVDGGAIYISGDNVSMIDSNFINCDAEDGNGGAIYWIGSVGLVDNSNFINNTAPRLGGAIFMKENTKITFQNSHFVNNSAGINGGAIDFNRGAHDEVILNSTFENNIANRSAGAVFWFGTNGTIKNSNFTNNKALGIVNYTDSYGNITYGGYGGAVMWTGAQGYVDNCRFENNYAQYNEATKSGGRGGAVYLQGSDVGNGHDTAFTNSIFINNTAGYNGGAIDWYRGAANGNVENSTFINNTAHRSGGAIYWSGVNGTIKSSNFINNSALGNLTDANGGGDGGAVLWVGPEGTIDTVNFTNNRAAYSGGAIFLKGSDNGTAGNCSNVFIDNGLFEDNLAGLNGGAVTFQRGAMNGTLTNSLFINNTALRNGGALFWYGHNGTVSNVTFIRNTALGLVDTDARGVHQYVDENGNPVLGGSGGAVAWVGHIGNVDDSTFINNTAKRLGGAIFLRDNYNTEFRNDRFVNNTAGINGGAIDFNRGAHDGVIVNSTFENNVANRSAGAVFWFGTNGTIKDSTFNNNTALGIVNYTDSYGNVTYGGYGGAVMWTGAQGVVGNCTFTNNEAKYNEATKSGGRGGAVYLQGSDMGLCMNTTFSNSMFVNNTAGYNGGAVAWFRGARNGNIDNSTFINNTAKRSGGAISWTGINGTVSSSTFMNNTALGTLTDANGGGDGGAILWVGQYGKIDQSKFFNNNATYSGGAIFLKGSDNGEPGNCSDVSIANSIFEDNFAGLNGGAITFQRGAMNGILSNSTLKNNTALRNGGALFWYGHNGTVIGCNFTDNQALGLVDEDARGVHQYVDENENPVLGGSGGAIAWVRDVGTIDKSNFINNTASRLGGAVYLRDNSDTIFRNSNFINNTAGINGGAIDFNRGAHNGVIVNSTFENNVANRSAGAVFWFGTNGTIKDSTFNNNTALGIVNYTDSYGNVTYGGYGGAVMWTGAQGVVGNCTFTNNEAKYNEATKSGGRGGAVYLQGSDMGLCMNTTFSNSMFVNNTAGYNGGAVAWFRGARNGNIDNSTFINNTAKRSGGAISWTGINGTVSSSTFMNNTALGTLTDANGGGDGGAILWVGHNGNVISSRFLNNNATYSGGAIFLKGSDNGSGEHCDNVTISGSIFENNIAGLNGGAVNFQEGAIEGRLYNSEFKNNTASRNGGAVFWYGQNGLIDNCSFSKNKAMGLVDEDARGVHKYIDADGNKVLGGSGGAIAWTGDVGSIKNSEFLNNYANRFGGAIFLRDNVNTLYDNSSFVNNTASQGGAIYWKAEAPVNLTNCILIGNIASKGSAIYHVKNNLEIINSTLLDNRADSHELKLTVIRSDDNHTVEVIAEFKGNDNLLNAIWNNGTIGLTNVTYLGVGGVVNTGNVRRLPVVLEDDQKPSDNNTIYQTQYETYQNITFIIYDGQNNVLTQKSEMTNISGIAKFTFTASGDELYEFVFHPQDNYYTGIENSTSKKLVTVEIPTEDIYYLENESFVITVVDKNNEDIPTGNASVFINGKEIDNFTLKDGKTITINLENLPAGEYNITVKYSGDDKFFPRENTTTFKVMKIPSFIKLNVENYTHGESGKLIIQVPENENNTVTININGHDYPVKINESGFAELNIPDLDYGVYTIKATYPETGNYLKSVNSTEFEIYPIINVNIVKSANVTDVYVNDLVNFTIVVSNDGEIIVNDVNVSDELDNAFDYVSSNGAYLNGVVSWNVGTLANGSNVVLWLVVKVVNNGTFENSATVNSKESGLNESNNVNVTALPIVDLTINKTVNASEVYVGDEIKYVITVYNKGPSTATDVNVSEIISKKLLLIKADASQGNFNEEIWYVGNLANNASATLTLTLRVISNGTVQNKVSVKSSQKDLNESNNKYECENVTIAKRNSPIDININDIIYGEDAQIVINLPGGVTETVKITVNNKTYAGLPIENNQIKLTLSDLASGNYTIDVDFSGDDIYKPNSTSAKFNVAKFTPTIKIEVVDILLGEIEILNVTVDAPGSVLITVDGRTVELPLDGGIEIDPVPVLKASANYDGKATWMLILPVGTYDAFALYKGNENYSSVNTSGIFHVKDIKTTVDINVGKVHVGEDTVIEINVGPEGASGNLVISVDGENYTATLDNGKATLSLSNIKAGKHSVEVYFEGNAPYSSVNKSTAFTVLKQDATLDVDVPSQITDGDDLIIEIDLPDDATGTVTVEIDGKRYTASVEDGVAIFRISGLSAGEHEINIYYSGDDKYSPMNKTVSVSVNEADEPDENITEKEGSRISHGILSSQETGNPIMLLILILLTLVSVQFKKFKK